MFSLDPSSSILDPSHSPQENEFNFEHGNHHFEPSSSTHRAPNEGPSSIAENDVTDTEQADYTDKAPKRRQMAY